MLKPERVPGVKQKQAKSLKKTYRPVEALEPRRLMAVSIGGVFDPSNVPVSTPTTTDLGDTKNGPLANAGQDLINLYREYRRFILNGGANSKFDKSAANPLNVIDGKVALLVRGRDGVAPLSTLLQSLGSRIISTSDDFSVVEAYVPLSQLRTVASDPSVATVSPSFRPNTHSVGTANNQADETELADQVRSVYGLTGKNVKVGIISDSIGRVGGGVSSSVASGDLPANGVQIISESDVESFLTPTDEGRAMAELIHDLAPDANLAFATSGGTQLTFANSIKALYAAGCQIIVDDIGFFAEPYFQPGVIDRAINDVVKDGGIYLTAAGNSAGGGFEDNTRFVKAGQLRLNDFDPGAPIDTRMRIDVNSAEYLTFEWDNPFNGAVGNATSDLDIYFYDTRYPNRVLYSSTSDNIKTGLPVEQLLLPAGTYDMEIRLSATTPGQPAPARFKFFMNGADEVLGTSLGDTEYPGARRASVIGHSGNPNAISIGAVPYTNVDPFNTSTGTQINNEFFSSNGPVTQVFDEDGNRFTTPQTILKPDLSGIDGTNTSFFDGSGVTLLPRSGDILDDADSLPNFFGTSAAAPNVAAVVALIKQAAPNATQQQILSALKATARPLNGKAVGTFDPQGGFGLIDAYAAVRQFVTPPIAHIVPVKSNISYGPVNTLKVVFSQQVSGFDVSDLSLTVDDGPNLLTGNNNPQSPDGGRTYFIRNLSDATVETGTYTLEITNSDATIRNAIGLSFDNPVSQSFQVLPPPTAPAAPTELRGEALSSSAVRLRFRDNSDSESGFIVERAQDSNFTTAVKTFNVPRDQTTFIDTKLPSGGRTLFYRVRARNIIGDVSGNSNAIQVASLTPGEVIVDNDSSGVQVVGTWSARSVGSGFLGENYLDNGGSDKGKYVRYTPTIQAAGDYYVYTRWNRSSANATDVAIDINGGKAKTVTVNQRKTGGNGWVLLGKFSFAKGKNSFVQINGAGANGRVIADAVRFLPVQGAEVVTSSKKK